MSNDLRLSCFKVSVCLLTVQYLLTARAFLAFYLVESAVMTSSPTERIKTEHDEKDEEE